MKSNKHIVFVGLSGIPDSPSAPIQRIINLGKSLAEENWQITYLNRFPQNNKPDIKSFFSTNLELFHVEFTFKTYYFKYKWYKYFLKILSFFIEFYKIYKISKNNKIDILFVYTQYFSLVLFYNLIGKIFHCKLILSYVELRSSIKSRNSIFLRINDKLFDRYAFYFVDAVNTISHSLETHVKKYYPKKKQIKIPAISDFKLFEKEVSNSDIKYFLFCGSAGYYDIIIEIINAYLIIDDRNVKLYLIINGEKKQIDKINQYCDENSNIKILTNVTYSSLVEYYLNSLALIIPIRNTEQDIYRFPHKISEFTASKRPMITNCNGEIQYYFKDNENAIFYENGDLHSLTNKMNWVINNPEESNKIGLNGFKTGLNNFSLYAYSKKLNSFLQNLINS